MTVLHGVEVGFTVSLDDKNPRILVIKPIATLDAESRYRLELKPELASRRTSGLFNHIIHFTTGKASNVPLEYVSVAPSSISVDGSEVEIVLANSLNPSFFISEEAAAIIASQPLANNKVRYRLAAPPHYPGSAALRVIEPDGRQLYRLGAVQYVEPLVLDSSSPNLGSANGGTRVVITGKGFIAGGLSTRVFIGGELVASEKTKVISTEQLEFITPPGRLGLTDISVELDNGQKATLTQSFEYQQPVKANIEGGNNSFLISWWIHLEPIFCRGTAGVVIYNIDSSTLTADTQHVKTRTIFCEWSTIITMV